MKPFDVTAGGVECPTGYSHLTLRIQPWYDYPLSVHVESNEFDADAHVEGHDSVLSLTVQRVDAMHFIAAMRAGLDAMEAMMGEGDPQWVTERTTS